MNYLLDTNAAIGFINDQQGYRARARRVLDQSGTLSISSIVLFELWYGVARGARWQTNSNALRAFLAKSIVVIPFGSEEAHAAGELRHTLESAGTPIGPYDLLIAAHAARAGATLVTANTREFSRVPGLNLEDWSR